GARERPLGWVKRGGGGAAAPPPPPESRGGLFVDVFSQPKNARRSASPPLHLRFRQMLLHQAEGHVVAHVQRVKERALLENDTYFAAQVKQFFFRHRRDVMLKHVNVVGIGLNQAQAELENRALAGAGDAQDHLGFTALEFKGDAVENRQIIKADGDIIKDDRLVDRVRRTVVKRTHLQLIERNVAPERSTIADQDRSQRRRRWGSGVSLNAADAIKPQAGYESLEFFFLISMLSRLIFWFSVASGIWKRSAASVWFQLHFSSMLTISRRSQSSTISNREASGRCSNILPSEPRPTMWSGISSMPTMELFESTTARSITFSSSRTLPGQP